MSRSRIPEVLTDVSASKLDVIMLNANLFCAVTILRVLEDLLLKDAFHLAIIGFFGME